MTRTVIKWLVLSTGQCTCATRLASCSTCLIIAWQKPNGSLSLIYNDGIQQIVGRERRERVSQLAWCGRGCFDSRRRVNSDVSCLLEYGNRHACASLRCHS